MSTNNEGTPLCDQFAREPMLYIEGKAPSQICAIGWEKKAREIERDLTATKQRLEAAEKALAWQTGAPDIPKNSQKAFWVAFKSKYQGSDKICCRFLTYCNEEIMPLSDSVCEGEEPKGAVPVGDDGEYAWTGWFEFSCDNCETQWAFDREVIAWMKLPQYAALHPSADKAESNEGNTL